MMGTRTPTITAAERDTVSWMRRYLCYLGRPGTTSKIKRQMRRRERREGRMLARDRDRTAG